MVAGLRIELEVAIFLNGSIFQMPYTLIYSITEDNGSFETKWFRIEKKTLQFIGSPPPGIGDMVLDGENFKINMNSVSHDILVRIYEFAYTANVNTKNNLFCPKRLYYIPLDDMSKFENYDNVNSIYYVFSKFIDYFDYDVVVAVDDYDFLKENPNVEYPVDKIMYSNISDISLDMNNFRDSSEISYKVSYGVHPWDDLFNIDEEDIVKNLITFRRKMIKSSRS